MGRGNDPILVIGAGVSGLTTAVCLAEAGREVLVRAAEPPERTTSAVAGAMWGPSFQEPAAKTLEWTGQSLADFRELALDPGSGVRMATVLTAGDAPVTAGLPPQVRMIPDLRPCAADELPHGFSTGSRAAMPVIDMPRYLAYLLRRLERAGGRMELGAVDTLDGAGSNAPVVVNCAGLGARELAGDRTLNPVFGQQVVLTNPGLDVAFMELTANSEWTCYFPHRDRVVCGGIRVQGRWDGGPDAEAARRILERCRRAEPRLNDAELVDVIAALRPDRPAVRVEAVSDGRTRVVHNYGHGGSGVSLSWGCAREAAGLALA